MTDKKKSTPAELFPIGSSGLLGKIISFFVNRRRR